MNVARLEMLVLDATRARRVVVARELLAAARVPAATTDHIAHTVTFPTTSLTRAATGHDDYLIMYVVCSGVFVCAKRARRRNGV